MGSSRGWGSLKGAPSGNSASGPRSARIHRPLLGTSSDPHICHYSNPSSPAFQTAEHYPVRWIG
eukprot:1530596-Pyramimonas_sp.AAC.1